MSRKILLREDSMEDKAHPAKVTKDLKKECAVNTRDVKRVVRPPFVQRCKRREFDEDKNVRKLSFDLIKGVTRNPTPEVKGNIQREFS